MMAVLKDQYKALGWTQSKLAQKLGVSLPTIKRWFKGEGIGISEVNHLCELIGVQLSEVISQVEAPRQKFFKYTLEQEEYLARHPRCLAFFDCLLRGMSVSRLQKKYNLRRNNTEQMLSKLDDLGLIEWLPGNKYKLKVQGEPSWRPSGPLSKAYRAPILDSFIDEHPRKSTRFVKHEYLPEDMIHIESKIEEMMGFLSQCNQRAIMAGGETKSFGFYVAFREFQWSLEALMREAT